MQKFVKRINMFVAILIAAVVLVGCNVPSNNDEVKITITGLQEAYTFNTGDAFSEEILLEGVTIADQNGKSYLENVEIKGIQAIPLNEDGTLKQAGTHTLRLNVVVDGKTVSTKMITVEVKFVMVETSDIIYNGDFETGTVDPFIVTEVDGGVAKMEVVNGQLQFVIESLSWQAPFPRLDYGQVGKDDRFSLEDGKYYEVSFDAKASVERHVHVQVGELFAEAPWFADALSVQQYIKIGTEMANYSFRFQADASRANLEQLSLLFGHGTLPEGYISEACDMIYDNIKIVEVDSLGADTMAPSITSNGVTKFFVGDAFDASTIVTVADDQDKAPTLEVLEAESTLPEVDAEGKLTKAGEYTIVYVAKDVAGNESEKFTLNITVAEPVAAGGELIKNNDFSDTTPTADGITDWIIFADSGNTLAGNAANGTMTLTVNNASSTANWNPQFKQAGLEIKEGKVYKLTLTLESTVARKVQVAIQNDQWWNMHLDQLVELEANVAKTVEFEFTAVAPSPNVLFFLGLGLIDGATVAEIHNVKVSGLSLVEQGGGSDPVIPEPPVVTEKIPAEGLLSNDLSAWYQGVDKVEVVEGKLVLTVNAETVVNNYDKQFKLEKLTLDATKTYEVVLVVKSSIARKIQIMVQNNGSWEELNSRIEELPGGEEVEIRYSFIPAHTPGEVLFGLMLGKVANENPVGEHTLEISKVSLAETSGNVDIEIVEIPAEGLLSNDLAKWVAWSEAAQAINAKVVEGKLVLTLNSTGAGVNYSPQFKLEGLAFEAGKTYEVEIILASSIARSVQIMVQENGGSWAVLASPIQALVAGEETTIKFEVNAAASYAKAIFGLMLGKLDGAETPEGEHTISISKLSLVEKAQEGGEQETPVENEYFTITANTTAGAANNFSIKWKDAAYKVTKEPTKADCGVSIGIVANFEFIALNDEFVQVNIITGAEPARNVSIILHTESGDYKVIMMIEGGAYVKATVEKVDCGHVELPPQDEVIVDNGNLEVLGSFFYAGNHCEYHFKVADVLFDSSYTYTVTCEDFPSGRVVNKFAFGADGIAIQFFIDGSTIPGRTYVFNITVANGETVLASGQIAVVA